MEKSITILGDIPSKANQYDIKVGKGKPIFTKKENIKQYEDSFVCQCWPEIDFTFCDVRDIPESKMYKGPFELLVRVYYKNARHDLDNAFKTLLDCCQLAKLIENDNQCQHINGYKYVDKTNPRVEFMIRPYKV